MGESEGVGGCERRQFHGMRVSGRASWYGSSSGGPGKRSSCINTLREAADEPFSWAKEQM